MIMVSRRRSFAVAAGVACALTTTACGGGADGSGDLEKTTITVGALPIVDFAALWVAKDKGKANVGQLLVTAGLRARGVAASPHQFTALDFPQMANALETGSVDAAWLVEPFVTQVQQSGGRFVLDVSTGPTSDFPIGSYVTSKKFAAANPQTTAAFTKAITQAQAMLAKDDKLIRSILPTYATVGAAAAGTIKIAAFPTGVNKAQTQKVADLMTKYGFLKSRYDVSPML